MSQLVGHLCLFNLLGCLCTRSVPAVPTTPILCPHYPCCNNKCFLHHKKIWLRVRVRAPECPSVWIYSTGAGAFISTSIYRWCTDVRIPVGISVNLSRGKNGIPPFLPACLEPHSFAMRQLNSWIPRVKNIFHADADMWVWVLRSGTLAFAFLDILLISPLFQIVFTFHFPFMSLRSDERKYISPELI